MSLLIRVLAVAGLLWTGKQVVSHISSAVGRASGTADKPGDESAPDGEVVYDPVCQTYLPKSLALEKTIRGKPVYFCGPECANAFEDRQSERTEP